MEGHTGSEQPGKQDEKKTVQDYWGDEFQWEEVVKTPFPREVVSESAYEERHPVLRSLVSLLICVVIALAAAFLITRFVAHHTSVEGSSMEETLHNKDQLIIEKVSYYFHEPERFDVIVFPYSDSVNYIKRIIGLPGERVKIQDGQIYINGSVLEESYGKEKIQDPGVAAKEIQLGTDEYFVLGDNRNNSEDSRFSDIGNINKKYIVGKIWFTVSPKNKIGFIK